MERDGRIGLFLGAGASCELGMPLAVELTRELQKRITGDKLLALNENAKADGMEHPDAVINDAVSTWGLQGATYEGFLGHLETQFLRPGTADRQHYHGLYLWFVEHVDKALYLRHKERADAIARGLRFIDGIVGLATTNRPLWIFSLNHDVLIESLASAYGVNISCGFARKASLPTRDSQGFLSGDLPVETITEKELQSGDGSFLAPNEVGINLMKIHGGLDVFVRHLPDESAEVLRLLPLDAKPTGLINSLVAVNEDVYYPEARARGKRATNEIVYLDVGNEIQFLRRSMLAGAFKFDQRYPKTLPAIYLPLFSEYLYRIQKLVCLGYGFGDLHINEVIRKWLESSSRYTIEIVGPRVAMPGSLVHLIPQVSLTHSTTTVYLERYSSKSLSIAERLLKHGLEQYHAAANRQY